MVTSSLRSGSLCASAAAPSCGCQLFTASALGLRAWRRRVLSCKMASRVLRSFGTGLSRAVGHSGSCSLAVRGLSSSSNRAREDSWLKSLFVRKVDPRKDAHSNLLAKRETSSLYKIQFHNVKPEYLEAYNKLWAT